MSMTLKPGNAPQVVRAVIADARRQKRAALGLAMPGFAVLALNALTTNPPRPAIHRSFDGGLAGQQWIVTGYTLMFSALLLCVEIFVAVVSASSALEHGLGISFACPVVLGAIAAAVALALPASARQCSPGK